MSEQIKDGTGTGRLLKITSEHRALTEAVSITEEAHIANQYGLSFSASSGVMSISNTNPHLIFILKNTDTSKNIHLASITFGWNGGNVTGSKCIVWDYIANLGDSTANYITSFFGNLNLTSSAVAQGRFDIWDGVGDGIESTDSGISTSPNIISKGMSTIVLNGLPILGINDAIGLLVTAEEAGDFTATIRLYYK